MKIVFFGTSAFAARIFSYLVHQGANIVAVVTRTDKPRGRSLQLLPPPVKEEALKTGLPIHQPAKASTLEFAEVLKSYNPDLFIVAAYGEIIKQFILDIPRFPPINVHPSLLPKYRGAAPMQRCLMDGEKETGVTIMQMVLEMDAGDILEVVKILVPETMTWGELDLKLSELAGPALLKVIQDLEKGTVKRTPQDPAKATFAPKITPEETQIDWNRPKEQVHNLIHALSPSPGAWCWVEVGGEKKRMKIKKSLIAKDPDGWIVHGLKLFEVQLEGKKSLTAEEFLRGLNHPIKFL